MMNSFATTSTFNLSNNHGMFDNIVARVVPVSSDRVNVTGFGKRAMVANPGCKLLLPNKEGSFELSNGCERGNMSLLRLSRLESKGVYAIEYRVGGFYIDLPVTIDLGYDNNTRCETKVSYIAHCLVSIRNEGAFLSSFALSQSNPIITIQMVQEALTKGAITLLGNDVDDMGHIMPRRLHALFNVLGLFLHGAPSITNYVNARAQHLRELQEEYDREAREALKQLTQADVDITFKSMETLPQLMASLAGSGLEPAEIDRIVTAYKALIKEGSKAVHEAHTQALNSRQAYLVEAEQRANYHESNRPDRIYRQEAARLPRSYNHFLNSGDRPDEARSLGDSQYSAPLSRDQRSHEPRRSSGPDHRTHSYSNATSSYSRHHQYYVQQRSDNSGYHGNYGRSDRSSAPNQDGNRQYNRVEFTRPYNDHYQADRLNPRHNNKNGFKLD